VNIEGSKARGLFSPKRLRFTTRVLQWVVLSFTVPSLSVLSFTVPSFSVLLYFTMQ